MNKQSIGNLNNLFGQAEEEGVLSAGSKSLLCNNLTHVVIAGASGKEAEEIEATDVTLVTAVFDDSGSIRFGGLAQSVRDGQHALLRALREAKQKDSLLMAQWKLGSQAELVHSYVPIDDAVAFDQHNYNPQSGTALYDVWMDALASNVAYAQTLAATGTPVTSVVLVLTDGLDEHSVRYRAKECRDMARDLLASEQYVLAFIGVGQEKTFRDVAAEMGFPDDAVLVAKATDSEIRRALNMVSQSTVRVSQGLIQPGNNGFFTI
jgi:hypothetical protein